MIIAGHADGALEFDSKTNQKSLMKKSVFEQLLEQKADSVIHVLKAVDVIPTLQSRKHILDLLRQQDPKFTKLVKASGEISFVFGDKYFSPMIGFDDYLCIPQRCKNVEAELSKIIIDKKDKEVKMAILKDFRLMKATDSFDGYFDIS